MPVVNPGHLLDQSDELIGNPRGGAPRQADLRRAISNSYYALFHAILCEAADDFVGSGRRQSARYAMVYRSVSHKHLRVLCDDLAKTKLPAKYVTSTPAGGFGTDVVAVAIAFGELQEKRHSADYDPLARIRMSDAQHAVATSKAALVRLRAANKSKKRAFLSLVVFDPV